MNSFSSLKFQGEQHHISKQQPPTASLAILNFLRLVVEDTNLISDFRQVWVVREFELGDDLMTYSINQEKDTHNVLYLVCQGRVRLLGFDTVLGKEVSIQLLLAQQTFGADHLFCHQPLPYRAIAASAGAVAQVSIPNLLLWLQQIPKLQNHLQQVSFERQALIFWKICTEFRLHKSQTLQQFLPYLVQKKIDAGASLVEATPPDQGHFWLRSGSPSSFYCSPCR